MSKSHSVYWMRQIADRRRRGSDGEVTMSKTKHELPVGDLIDTLRAYVIQETLQPLKQLGRTLALGVAGALLCGIGLVICFVGVLRLLQGETGAVFTGNWAFAPYLLTALVALVAIGAAVMFVLRSRRAHRSHSPVAH
jgi:hypothetical protein